MRKQFNLTVVIVIIEPSNNYHAWEGNLIYCQKVYSKICGIGKCEFNELLSCMRDTAMTFACVRVFCLLSLMNVQENCCFYYFKKNYYLKLSIVCYRNCKYHVFLLPLELKAKPMSDRSKTDLPVLIIYKFCYYCSNSICFNGL